MKSGIECAAVLVGVMGMTTNVGGLPENISSRAPLTSSLTFTNSKFLAIALMQCFASNRMAALRYAYAL